MKLDWKAVLALGCVALVLYGVARREVGKAAAAVGAAVNPVSDKNIFYSGLNGIGASVTGDESFNLGKWIYEKTH